ncbi:hypothetical protein [Dietzia psychralcaliphila]|uniref:hypothetical protein n=1 Tax=Dietzia psychralcaliphila TaxID=139021 RepID=UPI001C1DF409|nr:hypothetical protein [Dietzia psychralcaliphila]
MTSAPGDPAPWWHTGALAWLVARAYTRSRPAAALAWAAALATIAPYVLRRAVYESADRDGMVIFCRYRPVLDVVVATVLGLAFFGLGFGAFVAEFDHRPLVLVVLGGILGVVLAGARLMSGGLSPTDAVGPDTPDGRRWAIMALAQRPGTRYSALLLTRRLISSLPAGDVVVAVAADELLAGAYARFGLTRTAGRRVHRVLD